MSAKTLEQLRAAFSKNENTNSTNRPNNYFPFWNMKEGEQCVIRFLPDKNPNNPLGFMVPKHTHNLVINGERRTVPCLKMYGEECPICKLSSSYYKEDDKTNGKKYYRSQQHVTQVYVVEDPLPPNEAGETHQGKVRYVSFGFQLFNIIKDAFESGDLDHNPTDYENGYNFIIKKTKQGEYATYALGSKFRPKPSALSPDEIEYIEENLVDLETLLPPNPGAEKVATMLTAALTGANYAADAASEGAAEAAREEESSKVETTVKATKTEKPAETSVGSDEISSQADKILEQIRQRRANKEG